ncbi:MAG: lactate utilization protein [Clostridia bacterium]|nr:lactate utilization protein [Clostridia bacterium]
MFPPRLNPSRKKGYTTRFFKTKEEAVAHLCAALNGKKIGFGGSATLHELGLFEALSEHNTVLWHWRIPQGETADELRRKAALCPIYFTSANAISEDGKIVNIDGTSNRVAAYLYGKEKVYFVCGTNKLCPDEESAVARARNVAAPTNAARLGLDTPCAKTLSCHDCKSKSRICRALNVLWEKPTGADMELILIDEALGY